MTPSEGGTSPQISRGSRFGRLAAIGALVLAVIAIAVVFLGGGDDGSKYRLLFETGGQLVKGNPVLIGGAPVGTVDEIELRDDAQAEVSITIDQELHQGTSAVIRSTSLSGVANRYISITPGPDNLPALGDDELITQVDTTTPVDLDQLFNAIREPERKALQDIIQGSATVYAGRSAEANETYRYLSPSLTATTRLIDELNADERVLSDFLVSGSRVVTALGERRDDLAELTSNGNQALGAIASQNENLSRALKALPPALRQANTTFANLRPTLDDLDPLIETARTSTKDLPGFLRQLNPVIAKSVPVFKDLRLAVNKEGKNNDLADAAAKLVPLRKAADSAVEPAVQAMVDSEPTFQFLRPYAPDLLTALGRLGHISSIYDADGHLVRVQPAALNLFSRLPSGDLDPISTTAQLADYGPFGSPNFKTYHRCPGGTTQPAADGSSPFLDNGLLTPGPPFPPGDCDPTDVPLGP